MDADACVSELECECVAFVGELRADEEKEVWYNRTNYCFARGQRALYVKR